MKDSDLIEFSKKMLKEQSHWLNHFKYMQKTRYSNYSQEIKNKQHNIRYLKAVIRRFEK